MPRDIEHIVETHRIARERVAAGLPVWEKKINVADVFHNDDLSFAEKRDAIVRRLRTSPWLAGADQFGRLVEIVENLAAAEDTAEFDGWWDELYDHADYDRVWIETR